MPTGLVRSKVIAVWMMDAEDEGEFEHEFAVLMDGEEHQQGNWPFSADGELRLRRFILSMHGFPAAKQTGVCYLRSRVRRRGATDWISQEYPLFIEVAEIKAEAETSEAGHAHQD